MYQVLSIKYLVYVGLLHTRNICEIYESSPVKTTASTEMRRCHSKFWEAWSGCTSMLSLTVKLDTDLFGTDMEIGMNLAEDVLSPLILL
jgi:hypothetical protein